MCVPRVNYDVVLAEIKRALEDVYVLLGDKLLYYNAADDALGYWREANMSNLAGDFRGTCAGVPAAMLMCLEKQRVGLLHAFRRGHALGAHEDHVKDMIAYLALLLVWLRLHEGVRGGVGESS